MRFKFKIMKKYFLISFMLLVVAILLTGFTEDVSTNLIRTIKNSLDPTVASHDTTYDKSGIPIIDYGYIGGIFIGKQRNPVVISQQALTYEECYRNGNNSCMHLFLNCSDWLVENGVQYDNFTIWEYHFSWTKYNMTSPWRSGMAQGQGIQALVVAYNYTGDEKYLKTAKTALNSFYVEVKNGGVTYKENDGWWYEEYADEGGTNPRVLNGMIFALIGIHEYYEVTGDEDAIYLFDKGIIALKNNLSDYDAGVWTDYDVLGNPATGKYPGNPPTESYHHLHVEQLSQLYNITNDSTFNQYHTTWKEYEDNPPHFFVRFLKWPTNFGIAIIFLNYFLSVSIFLLAVFLIKKIRTKV